MVLVVWICGCRETYFLVIARPYDVTSKHTSVGIGCSPLRKVLASIPGWVKLKKASNNEYPLLPGDFLEPSQDNIECFFVAEGFSFQQHLRLYQDWCRDLSQWAFTRGDIIELSHWQCAFDTTIRVANIEKLGRGTGAGERDVWRYSVKYLKKRNS